MGLLELKPAAASLAGCSFSSEALSCPPTQPHPLPTIRPTRPQVPDWVIIPGGNLGNIYAFYKGFKMAK